MQEEVNTHPNPQITAETSKKGRKTMNKILTPLMTVFLVILLAFGATSPALADTNHCPDHQGHPGKVESQVDGDLDDVVLGAGTIGCVKGSTSAVEFVGDGVTTLAEFLGNGKNVSYYIEYSKPTKTPTNTPDPEVTPTVTNTPDSDATNTPTATTAPTNTPNPNPKPPAAGGGNFFTQLWAWFTGLFRP